MNTDLQAENRPEPLASAALTIGFAAAVACWVVWFITHMPAVDAPAAVTMPLLVASLALPIALGARWSARPVAAGAAAGLVSALINFLLLGSRLVVQPESVDEMGESANRFNPDAPWMMLGFLVFSVLVGAASGAAGRTLAGGTSALDREGWLSRFGAVAAVAFMPLLVVGGAVTSTESGMAVPDAVTSYGAVSFLFPFSLMAEPRIYFEHTHRLFGTLIGLTTLVWMTQVVCARTSGRVRLLALAVFVGVCLQGIFGIIRVDKNLEYVGAGHGVFAQVVFALAVALAALTAPVAQEAGPSAENGVRTVSRVGKVTLVCLLIQLSFGALYRHTASAHALWSHVGFSVIVAGAVVVLAVSAQSVTGERLMDRLLRRLGLTLLITVGVQFCLGWAALYFVQGQTTREVPLADELATAEAVPVMEALVTTVHQGTGALLLALCTLATVWGSVMRGKTTAPKAESGLADGAPTPDAV